MNEQNEEKRELNEEYRYPTEFEYRMIAENDAEKAYYAMMEKIATVIIAPFMPALYVGHKIKRRKKRP